MFWNIGFFYAFLLKHRYETDILRYFCLLYLASNSLVLLVVMRLEKVLLIFVLFGQICQICEILALESEEVEEGSIYADPGRYYAKAQQNRRKKLKKQKRKRLKNNSDLSISESSYGKKEKSQLKYAFLQPQDSATQTEKAVS